MGFWAKSGELMGKLDLDISTGELKWVAGVLPDGKTVGR